MCSCHVYPGHAQKPLFNYENPYEKYPYCPYFYFSLEICTYGPGGPFGAWARSAPPAKPAQPPAVMYIGRCAHVPMAVGAFAPLGHGPIGRIANIHYGPSATSATSATPKWPSGHSPLWAIWPLAYVAYVASWPMSDWASGLRPNRPLAICHSGFARSGLRPYGILAFWPIWAFGPCPIGVCPLAYDRLGIWAFGPIGHWPFGPFGAFGPMSSGPLAICPIDLRTIVPRNIGQSAASCLGGQYFFGPLVFNGGLSSLKE